MSSPHNQLSTANEDRTKVIVSACESRTTAVVDNSEIASPSRRRCSCPSRPLMATRGAPFRRRVSFSDAAYVGIVADDRSSRPATIMQNDDLTSSCHDNDRRLEDNGDRETFYDIWRADDSSTGRSDDGCSESTPRIDNYAENRCVSGYTLNGNEGQCSESIDGRRDESDGRTRGEWGGMGKSDVYPANRVTGNETRKVDDIVSNENLSNLTHKDVDDSIGRDEYRMRGGCGGCCCGVREKSPQDRGCCCEELAPESNESCAPRTDAKTACIVPSRSCCHCPRSVCKKTPRCEPSSCTTGVRSCGAGGYCGSGCRGGCGKPGQICTSSPRVCSSPAHSYGRSPCASRCPSHIPCPTSGCCSGVYECKRSRSPRCRFAIGSGCCINDGRKCGTDGVCCCRLRLPCECLGGGLDCRRCGRKVYQAEMQIASGVPYHSICFSCFCCRKPLEPLTYQENCGEIYCKQCYVRNFGPQGYGYGAGAGVLQTPL